MRLTPKHKDNTTAAESNAVTSRITYLTAIIRFTVWPPL